MRAIEAFSTSVKMPVRGNIGNVEDAGDLPALLVEIRDTLGADSAALLYLDPRGKRITREQLLAHKVWQMALSGDREMIKVAYGYLYGRPRERLEVTGNVNSTLTVESFREQLQAISVQSTVISPSVSVKTSRDVSPDLDSEYQDAF